MGGMTGGETLADEERPQPEAGPRSEEASHALQAEARRGGYGIAAARLVGVDGLVVLGSLLAAWGVARLTGVPFSPMFGKTYLVFEGVFIKTLLIPGYVVLMVHMLSISRHYPKGHNYTLRDLGVHLGRSFVAPSNLFPFLRAVLLLMLFTMAVTNAKALIPLVNPRLHDEALLKLDLALCGGFDLLAWCSTIRTPLLDQVMSFSYHFLFVAFFLSMSLLFMQRKKELRLLVLAFMLAKVAGNVTHFALPSLGDAYVPHRTHLYENISDNVQTRKIQKALWEERTRLLKNPESYRPAFPFLGIAAFPSLHCGQLTVLLLVAWRCHRWLLLGYAPLGLLLFASTIYFGWHYISDCVAGVALGAAAFYGAAWLLERERRLLTSDGVQEPR